MSMTSAAAQTVRDVVRGGLREGFTGVPRVTAIVPAFNEAETVGSVIDTVRKSRLVDQVIVVDNASSDATAAVAAAHGAAVVRMPIPGKGQAMAAGVAASEAPYLLFLDADLTNLRPDHVDGLVKPVVNGEAAMTLGMFDRGGATNAVMSRVLPKLTGERAMPRGIFESLLAKDAVGWRTEAAINRAAADEALPVKSWVLDGMFHRTKEQKLGTPWEGFVAKTKMLSTASWAAAQLKVRDSLGFHPTGRQSIVDAVRGQYQIDG